MKKNKKDSRVGRMIILNTALLLGGTLGGNTVDASMLSVMDRHAPMNAIPMIGINYSGDLISISAERKTWNIAMDLVYVVFGSDSFDSSYVQILQQIGGMPGVTVNARISADNLAVELVYQLGAAQDIIRLTSNTLVIYPQILKIMEKDVIESWSFQQQLGTINPAAQMNASSYFTGQITLNGVTGASAIPMSVFKNPYQDQSDLLLGKKLTTVNGRRYVAFKHSKTHTVGDEIQTTNWTIDNYIASGDFALSTVQNLTPSQQVAVTNRLNQQR